VNDLNRAQAAIGYWSEVVHGHVTLPPIMAKLSEEYAELVIASREGTQAQIADGDRGCADRLARAVSPARDRTEQGACRQARGEFIQDLRATG